MAIETMKSNKATELDNIPAKVYKVGGELLETQIYNLIVQIREAERVAEQHTKSYLQKKVIHLIVKITGARPCYA